MLRTKYVLSGHCECYHSWSYSVIFLCAELTGTETSAFTERNYDVLEKQRVKGHTSGQRELSSYIFAPFLFMLRTKYALSGHYECYHSWS